SDNAYRSAMFAFPGQGNLPLHFVAAPTGNLPRAPRFAVESRGLAEKLFDARVALKMATSSYARYLSDEARGRLFAEFDFLLEEDTWDPDDTLPTIESYTRFLKCLVFISDNS